MHRSISAEGRTPKFGIDTFRIAMLYCINFFR